MSFRFVLVGSTPIVLLGLRDRLQVQPEIVETGDVDDSPALVQSVKRCTPDLLVVDLAKLPGMIGIDATSGAAKSVDGTAREAKWPV